MGNTASASLPVALLDPVREHVIDHAGAVGGYVVLRVDPAVVA